MEGKISSISAAWLVVAACLLLLAATATSRGVANAAADDVGRGGAAAVWSAGSTMTAAWRTLEDAVEPELLHGVQGLLLSFEETGKRALDAISIYLCPNHPP